MATAGGGSRRPMGTLDRLVNQSLDQRASLPCSPASARCSRSSWRRRVIASTPGAVGREIGHAGGGGRGGDRSRTRLSSLRPACSPNGQLARRPGRGHACGSRSVRSARCATAKEPSPVISHADVKRVTVALEPQHECLVCGEVRVADRVRDEFAREKLCDEADLGVWLEFALIRYRQAGCRDRAGVVVQAVLRYGLHVASGRLRLGIPVNLSVLSDRVPHVCA